MCLLLLLFLIKTFLLSFCSFIGLSLLPYIIQGNVCLYSSQFLNSCSLHTHFTFLLGDEIFAKVCSKIKIIFLVWHFHELVEYSLCIHFKFFHQNKLICMFFTNFLKYFVNWDVFFLVQKLVFSHHWLHSVSVMYILSFGESSLMALWLFPLLYKCCRAWHGLYLSI